MIDMTPFVLAIALTVVDPVPPSALVVIDTVRVISHRASDDLIEAVYLRAGIVKQNANMRL